MCMCNSSVECRPLMTLTFILDDPWTQGTNHCSGLCSWWTISCHLLKYGQPHFFLAGTCRCYRVLGYTVCLLLLRKASCSACPPALLPALPASFNKYHILLLTAYVLHASMQGALRIPLAIWRWGWGLLSQGLQSVNKQAVTIQRGAWEQSCGTDSQRRWHPNWDRVMLSKDWMVRGGQSGYLGRESRSSLSVVSQGTACLGAWPERHGAREVLPKDSGNPSRAEAREKAASSSFISRLYYLICLRSEFPT